MFYINMNMVRAGVVGHLAEWEHCAHHEFVGNRQRYKIVNMDKLRQVLGIGSEEKFVDWYVKTLTGKVACNMRSCEAYWSRAAAVGDADWLVPNGEALKRMNVYDTGEVKYLSGKKWH